AAPEPKPKPKPKPESEKQNESQDEKSAGQQDGKDDQVNIHPDQVK
ncbi:MAG: energy transducer TonB, partial [Burkholderiales bacterium]|nr:energy transducer TonB [Burkholderiales bacterium]